MKDQASYELFKIGNHSILELMTLSCNLASLMSTSNSGWPETIGDRLQLAKSDMDCLLNSRIKSGCLDKIHSKIPFVSAD
jgi:hypothetical protein